MKVLEFEKQQPEFKTPIWDYVEGLVDEERVADGKVAMAKNAHALARAEETYGVNRYMLAAIWGVELNFGTEMGNRPLVQSLSTLACFGARPAYFRSELMAALKSSTAATFRPRSSRARGRGRSARLSSCPRAT